MNCSEFDRMLELHIDGELDASQRAAFEAHAAQCSDCREKLAVSEQLRDILSHMNDDISVPLPAQAAWRSAVRAEARRKRMKRVYAAFGAVAAVCVLTVGVTAMLRQEAPVTNLPRVEADGVSADAGVEEATVGNAEMMSAKAKSVSYIERSVVSEDPVKAREYLDDLIAEYGGSVERETDGDAGKVFVQVPGENAADFISAVDGIGDASVAAVSEEELEEEPEEAVEPMDETAASVGICVIITDE